MVQRMFCCIKKRAILVSVFVACGYGAEISVELGQDISEAVSRAQHGDTIVLKNGKHFISRPVNINTQISIVPETKGFVQLVVPDHTSIAVQFGASAAFESTVEDLVIQTEDGTECSLLEPYAMQADFIFELEMTTVSNERLNFVSNTGPWYNRRKLTDLRFENCRYNDSANSPMTGVAYKLLGNCDGQFIFNIPLGEIGGSEGCGAAVTEHNTFMGYRAQIKGEWSETIKNDNPGVALPAVVSRSHSAQIDTNTQIDPIQNIVVAFNAHYQRDDIRVAMDTVDVGYYDGYQHSRMRIEIHMKAPYTVVGGYEGVVIVENTLTQTEQVSGYTVSESCNHLDAGTNCVQKIKFDIQTCDMTGLYTLVDIPLGCSEASADGSPIDCAVQTADQQSINVTFHMSTANICEPPQGSKLENRVTSTAEVFSDISYSTKLPVNTVMVGDVSFWAIELKGQADDINIYNAGIVAIERTSDGTCDPYGNFLGNLSLYNPDDLPIQTFDPFAQTIEIQLPVTASLACATPDSTRNSVTVTFKVSIDYDDGITGAPGVSTRRDTGLVTVTATIGVMHTNDSELRVELVQNASVPKTEAYDATEVEKESSSSGARNAIIISCTLLILLICCCVSCSLIGYHVMKRRIQKRRKEERLLENKVLTEDLSSLSIGSTIAGVTPRRPRAKSTMGVQRPGSVIESNLQANNRHSMIVSPRFRRCSSIIITEKV